MRAHDGFNFPAFFAAEKVVREWFPDAVICNPARTDVNRYQLQRLLEEDPTGLSAGRWIKDEIQFNDDDLREALGSDLAFICSHCDLLLLLEGWETSKGALAERAAAEALGVRVAEIDVWGTGASVRPAVPLDGFVPHPEAARPGDRDSGAVAGDSDPAWFPPRTSGEEVRVTSATGGQKGTKLAAFDQISPEVEWLVAEHFGKGARKYDAHNFRKGYPWSLSYSALRRHLADFWAGKEYDVCSERCEFLGEYGDEGHGPTCRNHTGSLHIVCAIWHTMVLTEFFLHRKEYDDRYVYEESA
jgi:hypothetical protein